MEYLNDRKTGEITQNLIFYNDTVGAKMMLSLSKKLLYKLKVGSVGVEEAQSARAGVYSRDCLSILTYQLM